MKYTSSLKVFSSEMGKHFYPNPKIQSTGYFFPMGSGIDFPLVMNYKEDNRQETEDRRQEGLWSNVYSPKSHTRDNSTENFFYFLNGHGDVTYFADANFAPEKIETYEYNPWGVLLTSASKNNLLYTAREFDFETGLQFNRMRYYNSNLGRFTQKDLIIHKENLYAYAKNRPAYYKDKFGLLPEWVQRFYIVPLIIADEPQEIWDRCRDPHNETDCTIYCEDIEQCLRCCDKLYPYPAQQTQRERCKANCT